MRLVRLDDIGAVPGELPMFEGDVQVRDLMGALGGESVNAYVVRFRDGGGTPWHVHDADQVVIVTGGSGLVEDESERLHLQAGDVVLVPAGARHRHRSEPGGEMTHLSFMAAAATEIG